mgnify:CR=1 FL=1
MFVLLRYVGNPQNPISFASFGWARKNNCFGFNHVVYLDSMIARTSAFLANQPCATCVLQHKIYCDFCGHCYVGHKSFECRNIDLNGSDSALVEFLQHS